MPLLSPDHGFVTLSLAMFVLGIDLLAKLNHETDTQAALGLSFWRVVISAGILSFILSILNFIASYLFRDTKNGITARQVRAHGAVAAHMSPQLSKSSTFGSSSTRSSPSPVTPKPGHRSLRLVTEALHSRFDKHPSDGPDPPKLPSQHLATSPRCSGSSSSSLAQQGPGGRGGLPALAVVKVLARHLLRQEARLSRLPLRRRAQEGERGSAAHAAECQRAARGQSAVCAPGQAGQRVASGAEP